jgi:hypothetical protein
LARGILVIKADVIHITMQLAHQPCRRRITAGSCRSASEQALQVGHRQACVSEDAAKGALGDIAAGVDGDGGWLSFPS